MKTKEKGKILKAAREKQNFTYREKINSNDSKFLFRNHGGQKEVAQHFLMLKKNCPPRILYPEKMFFRNEGGNQVFLR